MKKIYMVVADNGWSYEDHAWWNVAAFTSKESAEQFIEKYTKEILEAIDRSEELENIFYERFEEAGRDWSGLENYEEYEEYQRVNTIAADYWHFFDKGGFTVEEYDLHE